ALTFRPRSGCHELQNPPCDEKSTSDTEHDDDGQGPAASREYDIVQAFALFEIASDQEPEAGRKLEHADQGMMLGAVGIVEPPIGGFRPAGCFENAGRQRSDIAR